MSADISNAISFAHALTKQLLHVPSGSAHSILIAVLPQMSAGMPGWTVRVSYADFAKMTQAEKLEDALDALVSSLTNEVAKQLEDGQKLLAQT